MMTKIGKQTKGLCAAFSFAICQLALTGVLSSCSFEQEDYFPESASLRITHLNEQLQERLVAQSDTNAQKYGWVIQYFVAGTDDASFEGFNIFGRFYDNGRATLASNHRFLRNGNANKYTEHSSFYEMLAEEGPVLSFNTWNDILTVLEDPVSPSIAPATISPDGEGMNGDHNLVLTNYSDTSIVFRGERHGAVTRFIPCDRPWKDYMEAVAKTKSDITSAFITSYYVTNGTDTMYFSGLSRGYFNYCDRVIDPLSNRVLSCVFTPQGLRLQRPDSLMANTFQEFRIAEDSTCLVSENGDVRVLACWDNYIVNVRTTVWDFDQDQLSDNQKSLLEQIDAELKKANKNYSLASIGIGRSSGKNAVNGIVVKFYTNTAKSKSNTAGLALNVAKPLFGQMRIAVAEEPAVDGNMASISAKNDVAELVRQFAQSLAGTYNIVPNSYFHPTGCKIQEMRLVTENGKEEWKVVEGGANYILK